LGDQNNSFFHRSLKVQHAKKTITHLWDEQGNRVEDAEQIKQAAESFYKKLLGTNQLQFTASKADRVRHLISVAISTDQAALLEKEITADEIKDTLFNMKTNKAPGPLVFLWNFLSLHGLLLARILLLLLRISLYLVSC
jgi:hypothetical protein